MVKGTYAVCAVRAGRGGAVAGGAVALAVVGIDSGVGFVGHVRVVRTGVGGAVAGGRGAGAQTAGASCGRAVARVAVALAVIGINSGVGLVGQVRVVGAGVR